MEIRVPHQITYETQTDVPVSDVIDSLLGAERLLVELGPFLEGIIPGLVVDAVRVSVKEISQGSLREVLWAALFIAFQKDLEQEVPHLVNDIFDTDIPHRYDTLITVLFCLLLFYGADQIYQRLTKITSGSRIRAQLDGLIAEVSRECHVPEEKIKKLLAQRYTGTRFIILAQAVIRLFTPSKKQNNAEMQIGDKRIEPQLIEDIPSDISLLNLDEPDTTELLENMKIELHAQDVDRARRGWAGVIKEISPNRLRMEIYPPIKPEDIYTKQEVTGDVILISRNGGAGKKEPYMFHLVKLRD